jgi:uncharacterized protein involved in outer membrane biogenesis
VRWLKWTALALVLVVACAIVALYAAGLNGLRGPISRFTTDNTGRELRIEGDFRPVWSWLHPRLRAERISFANPDWAKERYLFTADAAEVTISFLPLLIGRVVLPEVHLERPRVALQVNREGLKTWVLKPEEPHQESRVFIRRLTLDHGTLLYDDAQRDIAIEAALATDQTGIEFSTKGRYNGLDLTASGHGGPVLALRDDDGTPYPLKGQAKIGNTAAEVDGSITELVGLSGMDMQIHLRGKSMEELYKIIGVAFPTTHPYDTRGRLVRTDRFVRYEKFVGTVGKSDLAGTLEVDVGGDRPVMKGELVSKLLDLSDLGTVVGTQQPSKKGVLPDAPFDAQRWKSVDADVGIRAAKLQRPQQLPLEDLHTRIRMQDAVLTLDPLEFGIAGGKLAGTIRLDGRSGDTIRADTRLQARKLEFGKLFPTVKVARASVGDLNGAIELSGHGNSVARMLGTANGKIGVFMDSGSVSELLMKMVAIDIWGITRVKLEGDRQIPIRCVVGDFGVKDGVMQTNALVFDTGVVSVQGTGTVNLNQESLNLTLHPEPKDGSVASLRSPLHIQGTFSDPKVRPNVGSMVARGAGAIALALVNPLLAVIPLIDEGPGKDSPCGELIAGLTSSAQSAASGGSTPRRPSKSGH